MKHVACGFSGFQTQSDRYRFGTETVRSGSGLEVCWCRYRERERFLKFL